MTHSVIQLTDEQYKEYMKAMETVVKHDPASTTLTGNQLHGPLQNSTTLYGAFSAPGVAPDMYSAMVRPNSFVQALPAPMTAEVADSKFEIMTGVTAASGTNADGWCADPPDVTGSIKTCQQLFVFGKYYGKGSLQAVPEIGKIRDRADIPRNILNGSPEQNPYIPAIFYQLDNTRSQLKQELFRVGQGLELTLERVSIQGNSGTASGATELGWIREFEGIDRQVKTGYSDAVTGELCPAADSYVLSFSGDMSTGTDAEGRNFEQALVDAYYSVQTRAGDVGMDGTQNFILMRREMFRAATYVVACNYATSRCSNTAQRFDGFEERRIRDAMYRGQYLLIDGMEVPVVYSNGIPIERLATSPTVMRADMYVIPASWQGNPLSYFEYFPMDNQYITEFTNFGEENYMTMNNGMYAHWTRSTGGCIELHFATQMRLIMRTPFLAARIDDVEFSYDPTMTRSPYADETYAYADGGVTYRS